MALLSKKVPASQHGYYSGMGMRSIFRRQSGIYLSSMQHVIESQQFDKVWIQQLFEHADRLHGMRSESLHGRILASLFYEPSTRTRLSFESAMIRLGGSVLTTENARDFSSAIKGETLEDSIRIVGQYADLIVLRHFEVGAAVCAAKVSPVPIINGGDGAGQHPTQALLDIYTMWRERGSLDNNHIVVLGDLKHGRTARSLCYLLGKFANNRITFVSPEELRMNDDIKEYLNKHGVSFNESTDLSSLMKKADVVYQTRIQKERFENEPDYLRLKGSFTIDRTLVDTMKKGSILMHPLPRVDEIHSSVDDSEHAVYFKQAGYGVTVRMALLETLLL